MKSEMQILFFYLVGHWWWFVAINGHPAADVGHRPAE